MSICNKGGVAAAVLAALCPAVALALQGSPSPSSLTRGVERPALVARADGEWSASGVAVSLWTPNFRAARAEPEAMAREFLAARRAELGLDAVDEASLVRTSQRVGARFSVVRFAQRAQGLPVYGSDIAVTVARDGRVVYVSNAAVAGVAPADLSARKSGADALAIGKRYLGLDAARHEKAERMIHVAGGKSRLVWRLELVAAAHLRGDWELLVDAETGEVLRAEDKAAYDDGTGTVWTPDPLSYARAAYNDPGYTDGNNADTPQLTDALVSVALEGITQTGGVYKLEGPYAVCQDFDTPHDAGCPSQASTDFSVTRSATTFDAVMGYYHIHRYMKYVNETLGVPAMPINHPGGVHYDPHGFDGDDNSQFSSAGENLTFGQGGVDDAQDADVLIHELGHAIHHFVTGGHLSQTEGLSEGVGDYNAASYSRDFPGQWTSADAEYYWMFNWDGHNPFWPGRVTNYELAHTYAQARNQEIHIAGQYWASCNLVARDVLGGETMDKAYFEGLSMTGASTTQKAAAQAVINAAAALGWNATQIGVLADAYNSGNAGGHAGCTYDVTVPDVPGGPVVHVVETSLAESAEEGATAVATLTIGNDGDADLAWSVDASDDASCAAGSPPAWIAFDPATGNVPAQGATANVAVSLDASALAPGTYETNACVRSNDASTPVVAVPVTFTVTANTDVIFRDGFE